VRLKPDQRVSAETAELRAIAVLSSRPSYASQVADAIWPDHSMKAQGAGAAASRILKRLERRGLCRWHLRGWIRAYPVAASHRDDRICVFCVQDRAS
jgi:DNA-binding MarR family transcriptional regulator